LVPDQHPAGAELVAAGNAAAGGPSTHRWCSGPEQLAEQLADKAVDADMFDLPDLPAGQVDGAPGTGGAGGLLLGAPGKNGLK
jgi:hypothetical protein